MHVVRTKLMAQGNRLPKLAESMSLYFLNIVEQLFFSHPLLIFLLC